MAKVFEKESIEKGDQSGPRGSHRVFLHLEEREVVVELIEDLLEKNALKSVFVLVGLRDSGASEYHPLKEAKEKRG